MFDSGLSAPVKTTSIQLLEIATSRTGGTGGAGRYARRPYSPQLAYWIGVGFDIESHRQGAGYFFGFIIFHSTITGHGKCIYTWAF